MINEQELEDRGRSERWLIVEIIKVCMIKEQVTTTFGLMPQK